ncbi:MAG: hypothetical protein HWE23_09030 [Rhodobacteraceae bacterium]|nr:hypothetical protein [Paracoccaceae bacterium]
MPDLAQSGTVIAIMVVCGGLGGFAAWLLSSNTDDSAAQIRYSGYGYVVVGIIAAVAVPLFLSMAQSDLIKNMGTGENVFIFAGFCVVAGFSARAFMTTISQKLLSEMQQKVENAERLAEQSSEEMEELIDNVHAQAPTPVPAADIDAPAIKKLVASLDDKEAKVLQSTGSLTMRTATGIARSAELARDETSKVIEKLIDKGLAERTTSPRTGNLRFRVTPTGTTLLNHLKK